MSIFNQFVTSRIEFDNGYSVTMDPMPGIGQIYTQVRFIGERIDIGTLMSKPGKNDGFFAYLSPEDFAEVLYKVSKENKVEG